MSENCNHDCANCASNCNERKEAQGFEAPANPNSRVKKVIAVMSGKGGVGKSMVTSLLACAVRKSGKSAAVLDADITGPSIPRMFGCKAKAEANEDGIFPIETESGIKLMSVNFMLKDETDPVVWRGPVIAGCVKQFWTDVQWGDVDVMLVDMPPGTGDVPLTVFQSLPVDGIIVVTSPQELVGMIVQKAVKMAQLMNVPLLGIVENMSYFECPDCGNRHFIFGNSHVESIAKENGIKAAARLPIDSALAKAADDGAIEKAAEHWLGNIIKEL